MTRYILSLLIAGFFSIDVAKASVESDVLALYSKFVSAQNNRDLPAVKEFLSGRPDFLWISDGKPFWGRDTMIERMASFQKAEVWKVEPEYASAKVVEAGPDTAYLHMPLVLVIGSKERHDRLKWLVEALCERTKDGWRILGLFTAEDKRP